MAPGIPGFAKEVVWTVDWHDVDRKFFHRFRSRKMEPVLLAEQMNHVFLPANIGIDIIL